MAKIICYSSPFNTVVVHSYSAALNFWCFTCVIFFASWSSSGLSVVLAPSHISLGLLQLLLCRTNDLRKSRIPFQYCRNVFVYTDYVTLCVDHTPRRLEGFHK